MESISFSVSKIMAVFWLMTALLFIITSLTYFLKKDIWIVLGAVALVSSQILIFLHWQDAKWGTLANIIILICILIAFSIRSQEKKLDIEKKQFIQSLTATQNHTLLPEDVSHLPVVVQHWMKRSGVVGNQRAFGLRLQQTGQMKTKPEAGWMPFTAEQYFNAQQPAFYWTAEVSMGFGLFLKGRDSFKEGEGEMMIKLASLFPVVNEKHTPQINSGSMIRFLAEICWFPSAAASPYIVWEERDAFSAKATFTQKGTTVSGIFRFSEKGDLISFEAERYFGGNAQAEKHLWVVNILDHVEFEGIRVPQQCSVVWKLPEGDFEWLQFSVTNLDYNPLQTY
ncbi:DUF6920 family protein [Planktosalinus lacus]|nr:DUF6544 family protein [Planktosalinus lacus]